VDVDRAARPDEIVAGIVVRDGRVLLCHRSADRAWYPDVWDLPGGHIEPGETPTGALVRELYEELGIVVEEPSVPEFARVTTSDFDMRVWVISAWDGALVNTAPEEHDAVMWVSAHDVEGLRLAHDIYPSLIARAL
jgi:mutator protein MutT